MPLWDFICRECGNERKDKFFPTVASAEEPVVCGECGNEMEKDIPLFHFDSFKPFTTRNIRADGKPVHITSKNQWHRVMKENHVVPHPHNDAVESKADVREISAAVQDDVRKFPARYRKLKEEVKQLTGVEAKPLATRAALTHFGTKEA